MRFTFRINRDSLALMSSIVSERALLARINRKLRPDDKAVRKCRRSSRDWITLGDYHLVCSARKLVLASNLNLPAYAKELEVIAPSERPA